MPPLRPSLNRKISAREQGFERHSAFGEEFAGALTEKLLAYAMGRGLEYTDQPSVRQMLRDAAPDTYRWSSLILGIVKSEPFQGRRTRGDGAVRVASRAPTAR